MKNKFYSTIREYYDYIFPLNKMQVEFVTSEFSDTSNKLIEIGCANGKLTNALSNYSIRGIDLEESFVNVAQERYPHILFNTLNMLEIDSLNEVFDGIICFGNTLVHLDIDQVEAFISQCHNALNKDGKLLIQILNYDNIMDNEITNLPQIDNEYIKFVRTYELGDRLDFITELTIKATGEMISNSIPLTPIKKDVLIGLLLDNGFSNIQVYGSFSKAPLKEDSLPLIISCQRI